LYNSQYKIFSKCIAICTTRNVKNFETHYRLYNPQFFFEIVLNCGLYNPQCVSKIFTLRVVKPVMCFKIFTLWVVDKGYFGFFIMFKMKILKNYGVAGTRHGGAGRITRTFIIGPFQKLAFQLSKSAQAIYQRISV